MVTPHPRRMTTSRFEKLSWSEQKRARDIARQLVVIYRHQPEMLTEGCAPLLATLIHQFNGRYLTPKEHERIKRLERDG